MDPGKLPIRQYSAEIIAAIRSNNVIVVIGETGSGKTTQLSQVIPPLGLADSFQYGAAGWTVLTCDSCCVFTDLA